MNDTKFLSDFKETVRLYYPISDDSFSLLENISKFSILKKDEVLLHLGQVSKHIHFICKGALIAYFTDEKGDTYNKCIYFEKRFASSAVSALLKVPSEFTLQAVEDTTLISIDYWQYKELIHRDNELKNFYIAYLEKNWVIYKEQREISFVMDNATTRYLKLLADQPDIIKRIPLQHIASHLGITPTQLSRIRKKLKENIPNQHM